MYSSASFDYSTNERSVCAVRKGLLLRFVVTASVIAGAMGSGVPASAETVAPDQAPKKVVISQGMSVTGIDEKVARDAGFEIVRDETGKAVAVRRPGEEISTSGYAQAPGNCGYSDILFEARGGQSAYVRSGFFLYGGREAIEYYWSVKINDSRGDSHQTWGPGPLNFRGDWEGDRTLDNLGKGWALAQVEPISHAILWNGLICSAEGPATTDIIW
jgi:hypothetical protein